jgi:hypothetical protein
MSSIRAIAASGNVAATTRPRPAGGLAHDNSGSAEFAVKPALAGQDPEPDASPAGDPVVITVDSGRTAADAPPNPAKAYAAAALTAGVPPSDADAADEIIPLPPAVYNGTPASQAASAYAQMMQAWLDAKTSRSSAARPVPKSKARERR